MAFPFARINFTYAQLLIKFLLAKKKNKPKTKTKTKPKQKTKTKKQKAKSKKKKGHFSIRNIQV